ncbi:hypothetical protein ABZP36_024930 [Zizania latifolia]
MERRAAAKEVGSGRPPHVSVPHTPPPAATTASSPRVGYLSSSPHSTGARTWRHHRLASSSRARERRARPTNQPTIQPHTVALRATNDVPEVARAPTRLYKPAPSARPSFST